MKLNLGCGEEVLDGWDNYDLYSEDKRIKKLDLTMLPLPFEDNSVDAIRLYHVLEHLDVIPYPFMLECHRILKPGGELFVALPGYSVELTHLRGFHPICYMNVLIKSKPGVNDCYTKGELFTLIKLNNNFSLKQFVRKLYETIISMGSSQIDWHMIKK